MPEVNCGVSYKFTDSVNPCMVLTYYLRLSNSVHIFAGEQLKPYYIPGGGYCRLW